MAEERASHQLTSAVDLFAKSYSVVRTNLNAYAFIYAIPAILSIATFAQIMHDSHKYSWGIGHVISSSIMGPNWNSNNTSFPVAGAILFVAFLIASVIASLMAAVLNLRAAQGKKVSLSTVWKEFSGGWLWLKLLGLVIVAAVIIFVGFILLIVPGIILLWRLFLAPYILIDKKTTIDEAISQSWRMSKGHAWSIYSILLFSFVLALSGIVPLVGNLIAFVLATAYAAAPALRYQEIEHRQN